MDSTNPPTRQQDADTPGTSGAESVNRALYRRYGTNTRENGQRARNMTPDGWQDWFDLSLKVGDLPADATTTLLWDWFSPHGNIEVIDIFDSRGRDASQYDEPESLSAKIRFQPPPERAFWKSGKLTFAHPDRDRFPNGIVLSCRPPLESEQSKKLNTPSARCGYPRLMHLNPERLQFGLQSRSKSMIVMKELNATDNNIRLRLDLSPTQEKMEVFFSIPAVVGTWRGLREYKFIVTAAQMQSLYTSDFESGKVAMILPLLLPPHYFWKRDDVRSSMASHTKRWSPKDAWSRATEIASDLQSPFRHPVALHNEIQDPEYMEIGRWTTFRFILPNDYEEDALSIKHLQAALRDVNIMIDDSDSFQVCENTGESMWTHIKRLKPPKSSGSALELLSSVFTPVVHLPFEVEYQLQVCVSRGMLSEHAVGVDFLQKLAGLAGSNALKAKLLLEFLADDEQPLVDPMSLFTNPIAAAYSPNARVPHHCTLIRRALITPTTIRFNTPSAEPSNRVTRRYSHLHDRFLRVQFVEETEQRSIGKYQENNDAVYTRVMRALYQGIQIGDRRYEFLAFGNSQIKECGAFFFCPTEYTSCDDIRRWMGDFEHIKVVAKYAARLGQCFSSAREIRGIPNPKIRAIPDIERNGHCFTDGVGVISSFLARIIVEEMDLDVFDEPSAFQFRMGGCKGVLTVWPHASGMEVHVRDSQEKFTTSFNGLEIIRCARFATATLNRQIITILENLGIPAKVFLDLLENQLKRFELAMENTNVAIDTMTQFVDENGTTMILAELLKAGFTHQGRHEPFVTSVLHLWRSWSLKILKEKARIQVDQSAFVLGCVDETGTLRGHSTETEGSKEKDPNKLPQIFLQLSDPKSYHKTNIIQGICIVGRNPSLHPGDIRVVQAVDEPKLHHLKDVVVFPSTGDRPVPNMLSGGDLDGDDFFIIWDDRLIPSEWNHPPMDFTGPKPKETPSGVTVDDIRDFFVAYIKSDVLGLVATSHLAHADDKGVKSTTCRKLAEMHSLAVDFQKTGNAVNWQPDLNPRTYPHFMEKRFTYRSKKALGVIFDKLNTKAIEFRPDWNNDFDKRILDRFDLDNDILKSARILKKQYDVSVRRILAQHNVDTEFELWTGFAMSRPVASTDYKRSEQLGSLYEALKCRFRQECYDAAGGADPAKIDPFVAAMYKVTQEDMKIALYEHNRGPENHGGHIVLPRPLDARSMPLITFPWIFHWVMIRLALGRDYNPRHTAFAASKRQERQPPNAGQAVPGDASTTAEANEKKPDSEDNASGKSTTSGRENKKPSLANEIPNPASGPGADLDDRATEQPGQGTAGKSHINKGSTSSDETGRRVSQKVDNEGRGVQEHGSATDKTEDGSPREVTNARVDADTVSEKDESDDEEGDLVEQLVQMGVMGN